MSAVELKFAGSFEKSHYLKDWQCPNCDKFITDNDISEKNYSLWVSDYANEVSKDEFLSPRLGRNMTAYSLEIWLKGVEHQDCPPD